MRRPEQKRRHVSTKGQTLDKKGEAQASPGQSLKSSVSIEQTVRKKQALLT